MECWYSCEWKFPWGGQEILQVGSPASLMSREPSCTAAGDRSHLLHLSDIAQELEVNKATVQFKEHYMNFHCGDTIIFIFVVEKLTFKHNSFIVKLH